MPPRANRNIPLALTSATLTFGACGDDKGKVDRGVSDGEIVEAVGNYAQALCETMQRCDPSGLQEDFKNLRGCIDYYTDYYSDYYTDLDDANDVADPVRCRRAIKLALDCVTRSYTDLSCEAFNDDEYASEDDEDPCEGQALELARACEIEDD